MLVEPLQGQQVPQVLELVTEGSQGPAHALADGLASELDAAFVTLTYVVCTPYKGTPEREVYQTRGRKATKKQFLQHRITNRASGQRQAQLLLAFLFQMMPVQNELHLPGPGERFHNGGLQGPLAIDEEDQVVPQ